MTQRIDFTNTFSDQSEVKLNIATIAISSKDSEVISGFEVNPSQAPRF